jgi:hypothetical protein
MPELTKYQPEPEYQEKIKKVQKEYKMYKGLDALSTEFFDLKRQKLAAESVLATINLKIAAVEGLLLNQMENEDIRKFELGGGGTIFKKSTAYPVIKDKIKLFAWIKANKLVALLSVHHQTLKAVVNERLSNGEGLPAGVEAFLKDSIGHRGGVNGEL